MEERLGFIKTIVMGIAFVITMAVTFVSLKGEQGDKMYTTFETSNIPVVYMQTENGRLINPSNGYITDIGARGVFNGITPIYEDRSLNVSFYNYGSRVTALSYQIRDIETDQLLEDTVVKNIDNQEDYASATLNIKNLIEKDREYLLTLKISTDKVSDVRYYERIIWSEGLLLDEKLDFALAFNGYTYNKDALSNISKWIETDETGDNTNLGKVNIHSTRAQIGWGNLTPRIEGNITPVIYELTPSSAQISLRYRVVTATSQTEYEAYSVSDYYRLAQTKDEIYLMDYERKADQVFDAYNDLQSSGRINLGIKSSLTDIEAMADAKGKYSYFVQNGNLWCYARGDNKFTSVFSFSTSGEYSTREIDDEHGIDIISVDENGDVWFSVYGYMNGGEHDGAMGVSLFKYIYSDNIVTESVFIPVNVPFNMMRGNTGDVSYVNGDTYFVKINQYLYSIDLTSDEYMLITDKLYDGTYAVNKSGTKIAYHESHTVNSNNVIRIYDFALDEEKIITGADYGGGKKSDYLKIVGYVGDDLVYGMASPTDIISDTLNPIFPMYTIVILNDDYFVMKKYSDEGNYVYSAEIDGMRVNMWRVTKKEDGTYEDTSIDQILSKEENSNDRIYTEIVTTTARQKELYLNIPTSSGDIKTVALRYAKEIQFMDNQTYNMDMDYRFDTGYMIYGMGNYEGKYAEIKKAINAASAGYGFVIDADGRYVWKKTEGNIPVMWNAENITVSPDRYQYNLTGVSLDNVLYYVSIGKVVAAKMGEDKYVYIYDYDKNNIIYYDDEVLKEVTLDRETAGRKFIQWNNTFLVLE